MPYYSKTQIFIFIKEVLERAKKGEVRIVFDPEETAKRLGDEQELIAVFWIEPKSIEGSPNLKLTMDGSVFVKIDYDLYCDDRFALDSYQAVKEGVPVSEIIKKRDLENKKNRESLSEEEKQRLNSVINTAQQNNISNEQTQ